MKVGCGCTLMLLLVVGLAAGSLWLGVQMLRAPDFIPVPTTAAEGRVAQAKLFDLMQASTGRSRGQMSTPATTVLSESELNAFLSRHVEQVGGIPLSNAGIRLPAAGRVEIVTRVPLRSLLAEPPFSSLAASIPKSWLDRPIWLQLDGNVRVESGAGPGRRYLRIEVQRFFVGRQPFPGVLARVVLDPATVAMLRWRLPDSVSDLTIEPGRVIVRRVS